jgi:hypothetical protein
MKALIKHKTVRKIQKYLYRRRFLLLIIVIAFMLMLLFFRFFAMVIFLGILLILNLFSSYISRHLPRYRTSIELIMFGTVLAGYAYGTKIGSFFGLINSIAYYYGAHRMSYYVLIFAPLYAVAGICASLFNQYGIFYVGMTATIVYTVISSILVIVIFSAKIEKAIGFAVVNTAFNFIMFKYFAPLLLMLM